jgi:demethylmenaquinone methyltransferase/2-methoxy-6-polyprenyl-1,4-benzoquinol methylase
MTAVNFSRDRAVQNMFDRIARRYDLLNRIISFRFDKRWRRRAIRALLLKPGSRVLDIGTGTGDLAFDALAESKNLANIVGMDFSLPMLQRAKIKHRQASEGAPLAWVMGSAMEAPFRSAVFDGAMTAFVLRNVSDLSELFAEAFRVLKPGGGLVSLDMFPLSKSWFSKFYGLYFHHVMPWVGGLISGDREAYRYLSESVREFHAPESIARLMQGAGFGEVAIHRFLWGAVCLHVARKVPSTSH